MHVLLAFWLPILVSSVLVFVVSAILHTVLPWHQGDLWQVPQQDKVMDALRPFGIPPGDYMLPRPSSRREWKTPEFTEKMRKGPTALLTVYPSGCTGMGKSLALWFLYLLVIGYFAAYVSAHTLPVGTPYPRVFRIAGITAFLGYAPALWQMSIWWRRSWSTTVKSTIDGVIYAGLTAGTFGWLWPR